jgi:hypothetical protein
MRYQFFLEDPYDGLSVVKNMKKSRLEEMVVKLTEKRDNLMLDLKGGLPFHMLRKMRH